MRRAGLGLQTLLGLLPVLVVLPLLIYAGTLLYLTAARNAEEVRAGLARDADALAGSIARETGAATRALRLLAESPLLGPERPDPDGFRAMAHDLIAGGWGLRTVAVLDVDGRQPLAPRNPDAPAPSGLRPHHRKVLDTGEPVVSNLHPSMFDGRLSMSINVPVLREGRPHWVLTARLDPAHLGALMSAQLARPDSIATLLDGNRRITARTRDIDKFFGLLPSEQAMRALSERARGVARLRTLDGHELLWAWTTLPNGWVTFVGAPAATVEAGLRASVMRLAVAGLVALALGALLAAWVARRIATAVATMARNAPRLLEGEEPPYRRSGIRQLDALYAALQDASGRIASASRERARALDAERAARAEAERASRAKDEFLAMLSHELRNPLAPIVHAHRLIGRTEPLTERGRAALAMAERQATQLKRLIDDLLEATRVSRGGIVLQLEPVDVSAAVRHAAQAAAPSLEARSQRVELSIAPSAGVIQADPMRLAQALENLLGNAVKYGASGDTILLSAEGDDTGVQIRVIDHGVGIDPANLEPIFELFVQGDVTLDRAQGGLGIGLAWVRRIVELHGGVVRADSAGKDRGSTFTVRLPRQVPR